MTYETIQVEGLSPALGAEVSGVDLARLDDRSFKEIRHAWLEHQVLFFRGQKLSRAEQKAFGQRFGELHIHPAAPTDRDHPEVLCVRTDADSKQIAGYHWHTDVSCDLEPPSASILRMEIVPPTGGDTLFASMYAAFDALSDSMQRFLTPLRAVHSGERVYTERYGLTAKPRGDEGSYPVTSHPVVRTHPETGRRALYVNDGFTTHIENLKPAESRAQLDFLYQHAARPDFQYRFHWEPDSIAVWDNRCVQHLAVWDYYPEVRQGYRVTVKGDRPLPA